MTETEMAKNTARQMAEAAERHKELAGGSLPAAAADVSPPKTAPELNQDSTISGAKAPQADLAESQFSRTQSRKPGVTSAPGRSQRPEPLVGRPSAFTHTAATRPAVTLLDRFVNFFSALLKLLERILLKFLGYAGAGKSARSLQVPSPANNLATAKSAATPKAAKKKPANKGPSTSSPTL